MNVPLRLEWVFTNVGMRASDVEAIDDMDVCAPNVGMHHLNVGVLNVARASSALAALVVCALCFSSFVVMEMVAAPV